MKNIYTNTRIVDLIRLKYPLTAIVSIMHRVSGLVVFLCIPILIYILSLSVSGEYGYSKAMEYSRSFFLYPLLFSILFHLLAGVRHIFMDAGFFEEKLSGKITAFMIILFATISSIGYIFL